MCSLTCWVWSGWGWMMISSRLGGNSLVGRPAAARIGAAIEGRFRGAGVVRGFFGVALAARVEAQVGSGARAGAGGAGASGAGSAVAGAAADVVPEPVRSAESAAYNIPLACCGCRGCWMWSRSRAAVGRPGCGGTSRCGRCIRRSMVAPLQRILSVADAAFGPVDGRRRCRRHVSAVRRFGGGRRSILRPRLPVRVLVVSGGGLEYVLASGGAPHFG